MHKGWVNVKEHVWVLNYIQLKLFCLKARRIRNNFFSRRFFQKTNKQIRLYFYDTSGQLVFIHFLEEIEDTKKTFQNQLTFKSEFSFDMFLWTTWNECNGLLNLQIYSSLCCFTSHATIFSEVCKLAKKAIDRHCW